MTWLTTWPSAHGVEYAEHATEAAAAQHAHDIVAGKRAMHATYFETDVPPEWRSLACATAPLADEQPEGGAGCHEVGEGP